MAQYTVKFLFADATAIEETFPADVSVNDAKQKLILSWPAGNEDKIC
jgi:hypothetical protein